MLRRRGVMSEFDDEEYESFELDGAGRSAEPVKKTTGSGARGDDDLEDDDDFDESDLEDAADDEIGRASCRERVLTDV